jgi:hypothetical protein
VQRESGVDDVLDNEHVAPLDARVEILEEPDRRRPPGLVRRVAGELDEIDVVEEGERPRQIGHEYEARLQRADEQRLSPGVVRRDLLGELGDPRGDLAGGQVDLPDRVLGVVLGTAQEASFRPYR